MHWFALALGSIALFSISNHLDKYLLTRFLSNRSAGVLIIFSSLIGIVVLPFILMVQPHVLVISPLHALIMALNGIMFVGALIPYLYAMQQSETSIAVPIYQTIPVFGFILAFIVLGETLTMQQSIASLLIICGAVGVTLEWKGRWPHIQKRTLFLMLLSSFLIALNFLIFKFIALQGDFWVTSFWEYVGFGIFGIGLLLVMPSYRAQFMQIFYENKVLILWLNVLNEGINVIAKIMINFASLLAPLALVSATLGIQPVFVLIFGVLITLFLPWLGKEKIQRRFLTQKVISIIILVVGAVWLGYISP